MPGHVRPFSINENLRARRFARRHPRPEREEGADLRRVRHHVIRALKRKLLRRDDVPRSKLRESALHTVPRPAVGEALDAPLVRALKLLAHRLHVMLQRIMLDVKPDGRRLGLGVAAIRHVGDVPLGTALDFQLRQERGRVRGANADFPQHFLHRRGDAVDGCERPDAFRPAKARPAREHLNPVQRRRLVAHKADVEDGPPVRRALPFLHIRAPLDALVFAGVRAIHVDDDFRAVGQHHDAIGEAVGLGVTNLVDGVALVLPVQPLVFCLEELPQRRLLDEARGFIRLTEQNQVAAGIADGGLHEALDGPVRLARTVRAEVRLEFHVLAGELCVRIFPPLQLDTVPERVRLLRRDERGAVLIGLEQRLAARGRGLEQLLRKLVRLLHRGRPDERMQLGPQRRQLFRRGGHLALRRPAMMRL